MTPDPAGTAPDTTTLGDILAPGSVIHALRASGKTALLEALARHSARALGLEAGDIRAALLRREALGSTGVGDGVALPHARLDALQRPFGLLARLRAPLDFEAVDDRPVDLVFLMLLPAGRGGAPRRAEPQSVEPLSLEPLSLLASAARRLRDPETAAALRGARDAAELYALMSGRTLSTA